MKHLTILRTLLIAALVFGVSHAAFAETRIGAVKMARLMEAAPQVKSASEKIKSEFADREQQLAKEQAALQKIEEAFRRDRDIMSAAEREKKEKELVAKVREFKRKSDAFATDFSEARNKALSGLQADIYKAIVEIAEAGNYDLIVSESVLYVSKRIDITDQVIEKLKQQVSQ